MLKQWAIILGTLTLSPPALSAGAIQLEASSLPSFRGYALQNKGTSFYFEGGSVTAAMMFPTTWNKINGSMGFYAQAVELTNKYTAEGVETLELFGGGLAIAVNYLTTPLRASLSVGFMQGNLTQVGKRPVSQRYDSAASSSLGIGLTPLPGETGVILRADYRVYALLRGTEKGDPEKRIAPQGFEGPAGVLGFVMGL